MEVYVDQALQTSWTSSGTTTEFETVELDVTGQAVELRGVLADSEWLSIMEVRTVPGCGYVSTRSYTAGCLIHTRRFAPAVYHARYTIVQINT